MITRKYEHGGKVWDGVPDRWIDFSANINPFGCPPSIRNEIVKATSYMEYYPDANMKSATDNISNYLGIDKGYVLPTNGGISALDHIVRSIKPKRVIIIAPCFVEYRHIAKVNGANVVVLPLLKDRHEVVLPINDIRENAKSGDMLILCNPVNPIGHVFTQNELVACLDIMNSCGGYLVIDEAFIDYCPENTMVKLIEDNDRLIIAGSLTKMFAIPGVRLGYICANSKTIDTMHKMQMPWVLSCFASGVTNGLREVSKFVEQSIKSLSLIHI
jgi:threonine-phosphate decarboxylase